MMWSRAVKKVLQVIVPAAIGGGIVMIIYVGWENRMSFLPGSVRDRMDQPNFRWGAWHASVPGARKPPHANSKLPTSAILYRVTKRRVSSKEAQAIAGRLGLHVSATGDSAVYVFDDGKRWACVSRSPDRVWYADNSRKGNSTKPMRVSMAEAEHTAQSFCDRTKLMPAGDKIRVASSASSTATVGKDPVTHKPKEIVTGFSVTYARYLDGIEVEEAEGGAGAWVEIAYDGTPCEAHCVMREVMPDRRVKLIGADQAFRRLCAGKAIIYDSEPRGVKQAYTSVDLVYWEYPLYKQQRVLWPVYRFTGKPVPENDDEPATAYVLAVD